MIHTQQVLAVPPKLPPHVHMVRNKTGRPYYYLQRHRGTAKAEKPIRLPDDPRSNEFWSEYSRLLGLAPEPVKTDTVAKLIEAWQAAPEWKQLGDKTRVEWSRHCTRIEASWGNLEVRGIEPKHCLELRDLWAHAPATANNMMRCLSSMLGWSVPRGWRSDNPCREVPKLKGGEGYAPWPQEAIDQAKEEMPAELWWYVALSLYTGQRKGDVFKMKWSSIQRGLISVVQEKTGKPLLIPIHRELQAVLDTIPKRAVTILTNARGQPWTDNLHTPVWRESRPLMVKALKLVPHGLRKSAVVTLLEAGCTEAETAAITGQSMQMVAHYARKVNQEKLARAAILKWESKG